MTFQPPPPPPGGTPPSQPPGQWGPPPGGAPGPQGGFDPKNVNPLDWGILGAGVLTFLFSFISFYDGATFDCGGRGSGSFGTGESYSAWHDVIGGGFFSWFAMVFAVLGAALVALELFAPQVKLPVANRLGALGLFAAAALFEIIGIFVTPGDSTLGCDFSLDHGFGFWASLIFILAGLVLALMRLQQTGGQLPGGLSSKIPNIGGRGPHGGAGGPGTTPPGGSG